MSTTSTDVELLQQAVAVLSPFTSDLLVVGGRIWSLLVPGREVKDYRHLVQIGTWADPNAISAKLSLSGFEERQGRSVSRIWEREDLAIEVFRTDGLLPGLSNPHHTPVGNSQLFDLSNGTTLRVLTPVGFVASKLYDIGNWGLGNPKQSVEMYDLLQFMWLRHEFPRDLASATDLTRDFITMSFGNLLAVPSVVRLASEMFDLTVGDSEMILKSRLAWTTRDPSAI
ncbi:MAG TPA: hypothetical protein PKA27_03505 [Fimbriimonadaceae bacterium]|nr:hypothetical protein [Fimbriimonadaceae bacterium]